VGVVVSDVLGVRIADAVAVPLGLSGLALSIASWIWLFVWRCPRCELPFFSGWFFRNPFARRCLHCGLAKWSLSSDEEEPPSEPPHLQAEVRFLSRAEGGREGPLVAGYKAQLHLDDRTLDAVCAFSERDPVRPGDTVIASIWLASHDGHVGWLHPGKSFELREGATIVARGVVTRVTGLQAHVAPASGAG
jgi:hypothetical protein